MAFGRRIKILCVRRLRHHLKVIDVLLSQLERRTLSVTDGGRLADQLDEDGPSLPWLHPCPRLHRGCICCCWVAPDARARIAAAALCARCCETRFRLSHPLRRDARGVRVTLAAEQLSPGLRSAVRDWRRCSRLAESAATRRWLASCSAVGGTVLRAAAAAANTGLDVAQG